MMKHLLDTGFSADKLPYPLWVVPAALIGLFLFRGVTTFIGTYALSYVAQRVLHDLRNAMFARLISLPTAEYDRQSSGLLISKLVVEVNSVTAAATSVVATLVRDTLMVLVLLTYLLYTNWQLTLVVLILVPVMAIATRLLSRRIRKISRATLESTGQMTRVVEEAITAQKVIKVFGGQATEVSRFARVNTALRQQAMKMTVAASMNVPTTQLAAAVAIAIVVTIALVQSMSRQTSVGEFVSFVTTLLYLLQPLKHLADINGPLQRGLAAAEAVFSLIDTPAEVDQGTKTLTRARGELRFEQLRFRYPTRDVDALAGIDLTVRAGETVALVGSSGGGKSTLINLVPRFYEPTGGQILLDDHPIDTLTLTSLRQQIALVSQDVVMFNDTIAANVSYGLARQVSDDEIWSALRAAHLEQAVRELPQGLKTEVGDRGVRLSGGQRQRLAIARAILKDAPILLLDEATSALDSETERHVQAALETLMQGRTTLVVAHRLSTIERADRILVMDGGQLVEQGPHAQLLAQDGIYTRLYRMQHADQPGTTEAAADPAP